MVIIIESVLSPSFDMFDDFEQRGRVFKDCVAKII
jgi:UDP-N-acetylmuramoylalanine-D-glutamate ligase